MSTYRSICEDTFLEFHREKLPSPTQHKLYFDYGAEGVDAENAPWHEDINALSLISDFS